MKRYPHYWWPLKGARFPSRIAVLDCDGTAPPAGGASSVRREELSGWTLLLTEFRGGAPIGSARYTGCDDAALWARLRSLLSGNSKLWMFASPSSRILPLVGFWDRLEAGEITLAGRDRRDDNADGKPVSGQSDSCLIAEDPPTVIACRVPPAGGTLLLLDIRNWGVELLAPEMTADERTTRYGRGICEIVSALRKSGLGGLRCTAGSQSVSALRADEACVRLHCHVNAPALALERAAYHGGRCECYRIGDVPGPVYHLDVRSMYPALCLDLAVPVSLRRYHGTSDSARAAGTTSPQTVAADVTLSVSVPTCPYRRRGDTIYPVGMFRTALAGPELAAAVQAGHVTRWHSAAEYACGPALSQYYGRWMAMLSAERSHGAVQSCQWIKRVMNALPGKFAEPGRQWVDAPAVTERGPYGVWWVPGPDGEECRYRNIAWHTQREEVSGESYWSCPAIAAWVTSEGRRRLWNLIETAGRETVWYCDTDSILCGQTGYDRLLDRGLVRDGEAGYLRLIGQHSRCTIHGYRHYQLDDKVSCAGIPRGTIRPGESRGEYWWRQSAGDAVWRGLRPDGAERLIEYARADLYRHGKVLEDGRVVPWHVDSVSES